MQERLVLGTRGSDLARAQTRMVVEQVHSIGPDLAIDVKIIETRGDETAGAGPDADARAGRKGLFTAEIERALLAGEISAAVHSAKDLPSELASGTEITAVLPRGAVEDVLVALTPQSLESLPSGATIATSSVRRKHQLRWKRPDLEIVDLRGNVPTRLRKLAEAGWGGIILARAGLERLRLFVSENVVRYHEIEFHTSVLPRDLFLPAGGQGVVAVQIRAADDQTRRHLQPINHMETALCLRAERTFLRLLQADCNQPVSVLATITGSLLKMRAQIFDINARVPREGAVEGSRENPEALAEPLLRRIDGESS